MRNPMGKMINRPRSLAKKGEDRVFYGVRMPKEQSEALRAWAARNEMSWAGAIRKAVTQMIGE
jgi:hypothetical protein